MKYCIEKQTGDCWSSVISSYDYNNLEKLLSYYKWTRRNCKFRLIEVLAK